MMPYVTVWVDESDAECDGDCGGVKRLEKVIEEAFNLLELGYADAAISTLAEGMSLACKPNGLKSPEEIAAQYKAWKMGRLPGFTNYSPN